MKWALSLLCCLSFCFNGAAAAELTGGRTVYLMPMGRGLDQFIANRLTRMHVLQVVTDPAKADIVFTDQVGASLEDKLKDLYPPPPAPEAKEPAKAKEADKGKSDTSPEVSPGALVGFRKAQELQPVRTGPYRRARREAAQRGPRGKVKVGFFSRTASQ